MNLKECIKSSWQQLTSNKLRTFLTMLGMFIGIGSVILILSVGEGLKSNINGLFSDIGKGTVQVSVKGKEAQNLITKEDIEIIKEMPEVEDAIGIYDGSYTTIRDYKDSLRDMIVAGIPANFDKVKPLNMVAGRKITEAEIATRANVIIVSDMFASIIYGRDNKEYALGQSVEITLNGQTQSFEIIGLEKTQTFPGMPAEMVPLVGYIPFTTMDQIVGYGDERTAIAYVMVKDPYNPAEIGYQIQRLLEKRHQAKDTYQASAMSQMIDQINSVMGMVTAFISLVAAISLLVGGIGIMNIMLVTVKERTREIGIRKAIGATNDEILRQFLIEAIILTVLGGIIGMLLGYTGGILVGVIANIQVELTPPMILFAVGTSSFIGILFGVYPAYQAFKLDPVEALRYE